MDPVSYSDCIRTSIHEAAHATVALAYGHDVKLATILADDTSLGHVEFEDYAEGTIRERAAVRLAGEVGQRLNGYGSTGCGKDLRQVRAHLLVLAKGDEVGAKRLTEELRSEVRDLLVDCCSSFGETSVQLLKRDTLTGIELRKIYVDHSRSSADPLQRQASSARASSARRLPLEEPSPAVLGDVGRHRPGTLWGWAGRSAKAGPPTSELARQ